MRSPIVRCRFTTSAALDGRTLNARAARSLALRESGDRGVTLAVSAFSDARSIFRDARHTAETCARLRCMRVHLIDGTYELFRQHLAPRPGHVDAGGVEIGATRAVV